MKKNIRKGLKRGGFIETGKFTLENSKMYIVAALIMFHIAPLMFVFLGEMGKQMLLTVFMFMLNPLFIFCLNMFHAVRMGFSWKFVFLVGIISAASIFMYYEVEAGMMLQTGVLCFFVYTIFAFVSEAIGGFLRRIIGGY